MGAGHPQFKVSDGFILTPKDNVSTQCDIVVYDDTDVPLLSNGMT